MEDDEKSDCSGKALDRCDERASQTQTSISFVDQRVYAVDKAQVKT